MKNILDKIKGDKIIWTIVSLLAIFSFLPVYSASSNFGNGFIFSNMIKHVAIVFIGIIIMYAVHLIPYRYFKGLSIIALPVIILLLLFLGILPTGIATVAWFKIVDLKGPIFLSMVNYLMPIWALILGINLLNESINFAIISGLVFIFSGIWLIQKSKD